MGTAPSWSISLILPAFNEGRGILKTIADAQEYFQHGGYDYEIIAAVDGDDGTAGLVEELAREEPRLKYTNDVNRGGKGRGIRRGVQMAKGDIIGFADADNKTPIDEFDKLFPYLRDGFDIAFGSRSLSESRIERPQPLYRRLGADGFAVFMHAIVGLRDIADTQCGFKFFHRQAALDLFARQRIDGYMFDVEILYLAQRSGYRMVEVPVRWRDDGDSRLALLGGNIRNVVDIFRIRLGARGESVQRLAPDDDEVQERMA